MILVNEVATTVKFIEAESRWMWKGGNKEVCLRAVKSQLCQVNDIQRSAVQNCACT